MTATDPMTDADPCPWCKADGCEELQVTFARLCNCRVRQVECSCGARGPHADTREEAIAKWNERAGNG